MKKLAIVLLLVLAGCGRQVIVSTAPGAEASGGATPREAVDRFMASAKAQDLQAMSNVWGTSAGPARGSMPQEELEMREIYMMRCLRHDSYTVRGETPSTGGDRIFSVEIKRGTLTPVADFTATRGPQSRWYVLTVDLAKLNPICVAR